MLLYKCNKSVITVDIHHKLLYLYSIIIEKFNEDDGKDGQ